LKDITADLLEPGQIRLGKFRTRRFLCCFGYSLGLIGWNALLYQRLFSEVVTSSKILHQTNVTIMLLD
jgi:hypothetical protein